MTDDTNTPGGCGYTGHFFGARYEDGICCDGYMWDADSGDEPGMLTNGGDIPCPSCNRDAYIEYCREDVENEGAEAALAGKPRDACPFPDKAAHVGTGDAFRGFWLRGYDDPHGEQAAA